MTSRERIRAALAGTFPDATPIMLHNFLLAVKEAGVTHAQYRNDPVVIAHAHIQAIETYGHDGVLVDIDTSTLSGAVGVPVDFPEDMPARTHEPALASLEQVDDLPEKPDIAAYKHIQVWLESVRLLCKYFGDAKYIRGNCDQAAFSLACSMRTPAEFMMDLLDEDSAPRIERLLAYCCDAVRQFITLMTQTGADMVSNGDSTGGPAMISPAMYRKFALPWEKRIVETAHQAGVPYLLHICGNTDVILEAMLESGADGFELDYKTDMRKIRDIIGPKAVFCGNIDPSGVLAHGTPALVAEKTRELLTLYRDNPRFILNAGCAIPAETPPENLQAMIRTAREFVR
jgi:MtaA/CmuA family methyltransferase